ncbi:MAG: DUF488 domain-containing protein [Flavobacteriales bacterium]
MEDFILMLRSFSIRTLVDIRRFPGSAKHPQFNREHLQMALQAAGIGYVHLEELGGRRKAEKNSKNSRWRNSSFRGYADHMGTEGFQHAVQELERIGEAGPTAYMCSEAVWWRCHRSMVSDHLKAQGWTVLHIMVTGKAEEHPYTAPARIVSGRVLYSDEDLFNQ